MPAALERWSATALERRQGTRGSRDARRLVAGPKDRKAASRRGTARKGGIVGADRTAFTVRVHADRRPRRSNAHPTRREGWSKTEDIRQRLVKKYLCWIVRFQVSPK